MSKYFKTKSQVITDFSENNVTEQYDNGFVFTRLAKGAMDQTRSLRIDLSKFDLSSENRRILRKTEGLELEFKTLPLEDYSWEIHKMGKEFYSTKFGDSTMSASKIKEMFCDMEKSNMNAVFSFRYSVSGSNAQNFNLTLPSPHLEREINLTTNNQQLTTTIGYCLCYSNPEIIHYAYPFYQLAGSSAQVAASSPSPSPLPGEESKNELPTTHYPLPTNLGLGMMLRAIIFAKDTNRQYIYLGSIMDEKSKYKLQFKGLEWWNVNKWDTNFKGIQDK